MSLTYSDEQEKKKIGIFRVENKINIELTWNLQKLETDSKSGICSSPPPNPLIINQEIQVSTSINS